MLIYNFIDFTTDRTEPREITRTIRDDDDVMKWRERANLNERSESEVGRIESEVGKSQN